MMAPSRVGSISFRARKPKIAAVGQHGNAVKIPDGKAECVMGCVAVVQSHLARELLVGCGRQKLMLKESEIPLGEIGRAHAQFARAVVPAGCLSLDRTGRTNGESGVGRGVGGRAVVAVAR